MTRASVAGEELRREPRLADARGAEHREQLTGPVVDRLREGVAEPAAAPCSRPTIGVENRRSGVARRPRAADTPAPARTCLSASSGSTASTSTADRHERQRPRTDQHLARWRRLLEPCRDVDGVTRREPLLGPGHDLAGVDPDPAVDARARGTRRASRPPRGRHAARRPRARPAAPKTAITASPMNFSTDAAVRLDDRLHPLEVASEHRAQRLRIGRLAERRRAGDVAEQHRHRLAHLACGGRVEWCAAVRAARKPFGRLAAATRADQHEPTLEQALAQVRRGGRVPVQLAG